MLDFVGTIVLFAAIIFSINALTGAMPISDITAYRAFRSAPACGPVWPPRLRARTFSSEQIRWGRR